MRKISEKDVDAIAMGSTILGTGGGGSPYIGKLMAKKAIRKYGEVSLMAPSELPHDAKVVCIAGFGAPVILIEKLFSGEEFIHSFEMLEAHLGKPIDAVMSAEAGGLNGVIPLLVASQKNVPLVDADGMGRAFPRLEMVTFTLHGIAASPIAQADDKGNRCLYNTINNVWGETLLGATTIPMGGSCAIGCYAMSGEQVRKASVHNSISYAQQIGEACLNAQKNYRLTPTEVLVEKFGAIELFSGKIKNVTMRTEGRWNKGLCEIMGLEWCQDSSMTIDYQNEFLIARKNGKTVAMTPDLITLVDAETADPVTAETMRYGTRVLVLGMKADKQWRTPEGIKLAGPSQFGYQEEYVPIEDLNNSSGQRGGKK